MVERCLKNWPAIRLRIDCPWLVLRIVVTICHLGLSISGENVQRSYLIRGLMSVKGYSMSAGIVN